MLTFLYDPKHNNNKENFVQEQLRIELYIPKEPCGKEREEKKDEPERGVEIIQL